MFKRFILSTLPPRAQRTKTLHTSCNRTDGSFRLSLDSGWSEYSPQEVKDIMSNMQSWLNSLVQWTCPKCQSVDNYTIPRPTDYEEGIWGYRFLRCRACKEKTKPEKLGWTI